MSSIEDIWIQPEGYGLVGTLASLAVLSVPSGEGLPRKDRTCVYRSFCGPIAPSGRQQLRAAMRRAAKALRALVTARHGDRGRDDG